MTSRQPLFRIDPGWLFIAAGLAVCAAGVLVPARHDLLSLRNQLETLRAEEETAYLTLKRHAEFLDEVDREDPALIRRLAAAQLNVVPAGQQPILLEVRETAPITDWLEASIQPRSVIPKAPTNSILTRLAEGPHRLWLIAGGVMAVFVGLVVGPGSAERSRRAGRVFCEFDDATSGRSVVLGDQSPNNSIDHAESCTAVLNDDEAEAERDDCDIIAATEDDELRDELANSSETDAVDAIGDIAEPVATNDDQAVDAIDDDVEELEADSFEEADAEEINADDEESSIEAEAVDEDDAADRNKQAEFEFDGRADENADPRSTR